jgi:hypothetical protein
MPRPFSASITKSQAGKLNYILDNINVIIQLLRFNPPCLMDICFEAIRLTSCKYPSGRALGIIFFNGLNNYILIL